MNERAHPIVRVMIVEDDRDTLEHFARVISREQETAVVEKVGTGREAIGRMAAARPDVLLVDLGLPDIHGTQVIRAAARGLPDCDIMVITTSGDERDVLASIESGATGYVLKDCSDHDLIANIRTLRGGGSPMSPGIARMVLNRMRTSGGAGASQESRQTVASGDSEQLTAREADVVRLLARGYTYSEAAARLGISVHTVTSHIKNSYRKLAVHTAAAAVARAAELHVLGGRADTRSGNSS
jgi:DNA-binding NarL/FixJ family response regulator